VGQRAILRKANTLRGEVIKFRLKETIGQDKESCEESVPYS
jgi:hypothetical protein